MGNKKGNLPEYNVESVKMAGFPNYTLDKWKDFILKKGYTVIIIEQDSHGTKGLIVILLKLYHRVPILTITHSAII